MTKLGNVWSFFFIYNSWTLIDLIGHHVDENFVVILPHVPSQPQSARFTRNLPFPPKGESNGSPITSLPERVYEILLCRRHISVLLTSQVI